MNVSVSIFYTSLLSCTGRRFSLDLTCVKSSFIAVPRPQNTSEIWFSLGRTCLKLDLGDAIQFKVDCNRKYWLTGGTLRGFGLWSRLLACAWTLSWHPSQNAVESKPDPWSPKQDKHSKEASLPQIMHCRGAEKYRAKSMTIWVSFIESPISLNYIK